MPSPSESSLSKPDFIPDNLFTTDRGQEITNAAWKKAGIL